MKKDDASMVSVPSVISTTESSRSSHGSGKHKKRTSKSRSKSKTHEGSSLDLTVPAADEISPNEKIIADYLATLNRHGSVEEMLTFFASPDVEVAPEDAPAVPASVFAQILVDCYLSFQDMSFDGHSIKEIRPGVVYLEDNVVTGTHTGVPYQPLPSLPPVPASGKYVVLDPERVYFTMENGKITRMEVIALGCNSGVTGLYTLAGGKM